MLLLINEPLGESLRGSTEYACYWTEQNWHLSNQDRIFQWYFTDGAASMTSIVSVSLDGRDIECDLCKLYVSGQMYITAKKSCKVYNASGTLLATLSANQKVALDYICEAGAGFYVIRF